MFQQKLLLSPYTNHGVTCKGFHDIILIPVSDKYHTITVTNVELTYLAHIMLS